MEGKKFCSLNEFNSALIGKAQKQKKYLESKIEYYKNLLNNKSLSTNEVNEINKLIHTFEISMQKYDIGERALKEQIIKNTN